MLMVNVLGAFALLGLGLYGMATRKEPFRVMIGAALTQYAAQLLLVSAGVRVGGAYSLFTLTAPGRAGFTVEPVPQSLAVLSILTGLAVNALGLALCVRLCREHGSHDTELSRGWKS